MFGFLNSVEAEELFYFVITGRTWGLLLLCFHQVSSLCKFGFRQLLQHLNY